MKEGQPADRARASLPLWARLTLLVLVAALPLMALVVFDMVKHARIEAAQAAGEALHSARAVAQHTELKLRRARDLLAWLAQQPGVRQMDAQHCDPVFGAFGGLFPEYTNLITVSLDGRRVCG